MNESDKLFMKTAEKQQEIIDVLLEACKEALKNVSGEYFKHGEQIKMDHIIILSKTSDFLQQAIRQAESK